MLVDLFVAVVIYAVARFVVFPRRSFDAGVGDGAVLASWDPYNIPNLSEKAGTVRFRDMIRGVTIKKELDESSGRIATVIIEHKEDLNPSVEICDESGKVQAVYSIPTGAQVSVHQEVVTRYDINALLMYQAHSELGRVDRGVITAEGGGCGLRELP